VPLSTEVPHQYQIFKKESKNHPNNNQNLIKERVQAINDEFLEWFVRIQVVRRWRYFIKMFILWVNGIEEVT
jgi:hypothetical protein